MAGASLMFFGFLGFESISMTVDEIKEPQKNVPRGIVLALIIVASLYAVVSLVLTGVVHYTKLNVDDAVAYALRYIGISWAANYVSVVAIMTLITVCISMAYALAVWFIAWRVMVSSLKPSKRFQRLIRFHIMRHF